MNIGVEILARELAVHTKYWAQALMSYKEKMSPFGWVKGPCAYQESCYSVGILYSAGEDCVCPR